MQPFRHSTDAHRKSTRRNFVIVVHHDLIMDTTRKVLSEILCW